MEIPIQQAALTLGILPSVLIQRIEDGELKRRKKRAIWYGSREGEAMGNGNFWEGSL